MEYDYDLIEMPEDYDDIDVKETVERVIKVCNETLEEFGLQSSQNYDSEKLGLEYFDSAEIQDQHRLIIIYLCNSIHELFDTDDDCEAIWNAAQMSDKSIRKIIIESVADAINENLNSAAMDSILDFLKENYDEEDSLNEIEKIILAKNSLAEFAKQHS